MDAASTSQGATPPDERRPDAAIKRTTRRLPHPDIHEEKFMHRKATSCGLRVFIAAAFAIGLPAAAMANRGGGDSGDSSMNPFTGDSYAYFHNGHNLGEQGTIRPNRVPDKRNPAQAAKGSDASAPSMTARARQPEPVQNPAPERPVGQ
jgi:hypothetical protein